MKKLLITALLFVSTIAQADDLLIGQYTRHAAKFYNNACFDRLKSECDLTVSDNHPMIGINSDGYTAFVMKNSFNRTSVAVLKTYDFELTSNIRPFVSAGFVSGYQDAVPVEWNGIAPVVYTGFDIHPASDNFGVIITIVPRTFVGIGLRFNIGEVF